MYRLPPTNRQTTKLTIIGINCKDWIKKIVNANTITNKQSIYMTNTYPKQKVQQKYHVLDAWTDVCEIAHASPIHCHRHVYVRSTLIK
jgi:hypothetical protein